MGHACDSNWTLHCRSSMLPEKIGDYNILDSLGSGTFGDVYKVEKDGNVFALKHIVLGSNVDKVVLQLEVDSHGSLPKHDNIVRFIDYFKSWYRWNIVLEFCELGTLEKYIVTKQPGLEIIKSFMLDMALGLHHLHSNNIVHRDIKPENILLMKGRSDIPVCKISDFGVARFISLSSENKERNGGTNGETYFKSIRGSPFYVAPEVRKGEYTKSCDMFSMGIVYYLMFAQEVTSEKRLTPWIRGGTPFYRATDEQIKGQLSLHVTDDKFNQLIGSMMLIDFHGRISASSLVDELHGNKTSSLVEELQGNKTSSLEEELQDNKTSSLEEELHGNDKSSIVEELQENKTSSLEEELHGNKTSSLEEGLEGSKTSSLVDELHGNNTSSLVHELPGYKTSEDEVFTSACILFAIIIMLVCFPFSLFVFCMVLLWVAGQEFLPEGNLKLLN